ncbi:cation transporter [Litorilinea aerophila]|uniref:HMA domain-containing protein n=1 Tax=Litorilinea aerophila TaxID=1204385 RepID=A0A540VI55_9CHLR|nr:cation transporter [Litorilinea aerophila]MCC9076005.1 cation transporter [Litorilinea aerophila]OUC08974.1 hypothetical protein RY27_05780 [Litorilinea aerophila]GIV80284.1 MAG: hypothetical protein KatS3mg050_4678 [Litorilinea sp.]GIV80417.1 MAG: hypothetical protein KatS3mg050_4811 [Litorilinea sp.]
MCDHEQACSVEPFEKPLEPGALETAQVAYLAVWGMGCPRCATRVRNGLLQVEGVLMAQVALTDGIAAAAYDPERVQPASLVAAVAAAGHDGRHSYRAQLMATMALQTLPDGYFAENPSRSAEDER